MGCFARKGRTGLETSVLQRVASGDEVAVEECIDRFGGLVHAIARRMSPSLVDADDATQEIFIDVWTHAHRYRPDVASEKTFIAMIARRRLIDRWRRAERQPRSDSLDLGLETADRSSDGLSLETSEELSRVRGAIEKLDPTPREVLKLSVYDGLSHQAIADRLGLPLGTVKTHVRRGLSRVRSSLGAESSGSGKAVS